MKRFEPHKEITLKEKFRIYEPQKSKGWVYNGLCVIVPFILISYVSLVFFAILRSSTNGGFFLIIVIGFTSFSLIIFMIASFIFLLWYPTMRYELSEDKLVLRCGSLKSEIPLTSIKEIRKKNLKYHPSSTGWKLPGYCIFRIKYTDEDWVRMYSRAMLRNIIIIETDKEKYGITPREEEEFLVEISEKTGIKQRIEITTKRKSKRV